MSDRQPNPRLIAGLLVVNSVLIIFVVYLLLSRG